MTEVEWLDEFGKQLERRLEYAWMNRAELANATGISQATISRYILGQQKPTVVNIINIARALDCSIDILIDFGEDIR